MALIVHKYGGTSVGNVERIKNVAAAWPSGTAPGINWCGRLRDERRDQPADRAGQGNPGQPDPRELDVVASTGEQVTIVCCRWR